MTRRDVTGLVAEHARELRFVVEKRQDATRDVDGAAWQRKRVDRGGIRDAVMPRQSRALGDGRELHADAVDVGLQVGVAVDAHLFLHLRVAFLSRRDLLRLAHQVDLALAGGRIGRAGGNECDRDDRRESIHELAVLRVHPTVHESLRQSASTPAAAVDAATRR